MIAAILLERNLQSVANYLILSLAVADLLVAVLVMPLGAVYEVRHLARISRDNLRTSKAVGIDTYYVKITNLRIQMF